MCVAVQLPFWCCWLVETPRPGGLRLPVGIAHLQQMVLDEHLAPESWVAADEQAEPQRLKNRPELIPFASLRRKITRLHQAREDDEAVRWIRRFEDFDEGRRQRDLAHIQFIEALIVEKSQPHRAEAIYLELLRRPGHDLRWVVHNNLAVLRCRANRLAEAWLHLAAAAERTPPLVAALLNFRRLLEYMLRAPRNGATPATATDINELEAELAQVGSRLEEVTQGAELRGQLTRSQPRSTDELAALLAEEDVPDGAANPLIADEHKLIALRCLKYARQNLAERHWEQGWVWANEALKHDPAEAAVVIEAEYLLALARARAEQEERNRYVALCREAIPAIEEQLQRNELPAAFNAATELLAQLDQAPQAVAAETRDHVQRLLARIRRAQAQQAFNAGMAARESDPDRARQHWREAAQHPDFAIEAGAQMALLERADAEREYQAALNQSQYEAARARALRWAELSPAPVIQETARQWVERANRLQSEGELDRALRHVARGRFDEARDLVRSASLRHPAAEARQARLLEQIDAAEAKHARRQRQPEQRANERTGETGLHDFQGVSQLDEIERLIGRRQLAQAGMLLGGGEARGRSDDGREGTLAPYDPFEFSRLRAEGAVPDGSCAPVRPIPEFRSWWSRCWLRLRRTGRSNEEVAI